MSEEMTTTETTIETTGAETAGSVNESTDNGEVSTPLGIGLIPNETLIKDKSEKEKPSRVGKKIAPETPAIVPPPYVANTKFKVLDQEKEFDDWAKPLITTKEMEEKFRDLYTKAHGLSKIKTERDSLRTEFDNFKGSVVKEYGPIVQNFTHLSNLAGQARQSNDWGQFFQAAKIPVQSIIQWSARAVAELEKNPNYLNEIQTNYQSKQKFTSLEEENRSLKQQLQQTYSQGKETELEWTLKTPEVQTLAQSFDTRLGQGAFRNEIIRHGAMIEMTEGRVASASEIIEDLKKKYLFAPQAPNTPNQNVQMEQVQMGGNPDVQQSSDGKPVLPNIKGRSTSPAKTVIKSTDDLRRIRDARANG